MEYPIVRPAVAVLLATITLSCCTNARADKGLLSIRCNGDSVEAPFIFDQRGANVRNGARVIIADSGYVIYRISVGNCTPEQVYYSASVTSYSLEFSPDGRIWSNMVRRPRANELPKELTRVSNGFAPEWRSSAKETGTVYLRFSRLPGSKAPFSLKSIHFQVVGSPLPSGFRTSPKDFRNSWFQIEHKSGGSVPGLLMMLVGLIAFLLCRWRWKAPARLFGLGALLWTVSVAIKFLIAIPLNEPIDALLHQAFPKRFADPVFWIYVGLLTGITEVGIFLPMSNWFRRRQWSFRDAASVGIGFGAVEAVLLGFSVALAVVTGKVADPGFTFVPVLERFLVIFVHVVTVVAPIYAITRRKWGWLFFAFLYKSGLDGAAAYVLLAASHLMNMHPWFVELAIFGPFAYVSVPILFVINRRWSCGKLGSETEDCL